MGNGAAGTLYMPNKPPSDTPTSLELLDDTGRSNSDYLTNINTSRITGSGPADSIIRLYDGSSLVGNGYSDSNGNFTANITSALLDGVHTITATAEGICHSESPQSTATVDITIDTQPPAVPMTPSLHPSSDTGVDSNDNITRDWGPSLIGTCEADVDIKLYEGETLLGVEYTPGTTYEVRSDQLAEGNHSISATASDAAGNESAKSGTVTFLLDTTDPVITNPSASPLECWPAGKIFDFGMTATDALSGMASASSQKVTLRKETTEITLSMYSAGGSNYAVPWDSDGRSGGTYVVDFMVMDVAGNIGELPDAASICLLAAVPADFDRDGDVDSDDFTEFQNCASGPAINHDGSPLCHQADFDEDGDVDQSDFSVFQRCYGGADQPADPACAQ